MRAVIVIDAWKLPIFERHLTQAGYSFKDPGEWPKGCRSLTVETANPEALGVVVKAANAEAAMTGEPQ